MGILQIVADTDQTATLDLRPFNANDVSVIKQTAGKAATRAPGDAKAKRSGALKVERKFGGKETLKGTVKPNDPSKKSRLQQCLTDGPGAPAESDWKSGEEKDFEARPPENAELWPSQAEAKVVNVCGRGCDEVWQSVRVESFPSDQYEVSACLDIFDGFTRETNKSLKAWSRRFKVGPVEPGLQLVRPSGSFTASWGWREGRDWKAYYQFETEMGLKPLIGIGVSVKLSAAEAALTAAGVPPPLGEFAAHHLADMVLIVGGSASVEITGRGTYRAYTYAPSTTDLALVAAVVGEFKVSLTARVGSDYVVSASLTGSGIAKITGSFDFTADKEGFFWQPRLVLNAVKISAIVKMRAFWVGSYDKKLAEKKFWERYPILEGDKHKLLPRGDDKAKG